MTWSRSLVTMVLVTMIICVTMTGQASPNIESLDGDMDSLDVEDDESMAVFNVRHRQKRGLMYPGTKWCGDGDIAEDYDDLGNHRETDACCRQHDHCNDTIPAREAKRGLKNDSPYTRLNCDCDETFRACLKNVSNFVSSLVGSLYFDVSRAQCYRLDYPATCTDRNSRTERCLEYTYNDKEEKIWQFFEQKRWKKKKHVSKKNVTSTAAPDLHIYTVTDIPEAALTSSATFLLGASGSCVVLVLLVALMAVYRRTCYTAGGARYQRVSTIEDKVLPPTGTLPN